MEAKEATFSPFFKTILFLVGCVVALVAGDFILAHFYFAKNEQNRYDNSDSRKIGWQTEANQNWTLHKEGYGRVRFTTTKFGFRRYGNTKSKNTRIFVIGDSPTEALSVTDGETYYDYLSAQEHGVELFVRGTQGYSSIQKYMVLDQYLGDIQPDVVVWQFHANDITQDNPSTDTVQPNSTRRVRPYLHENKIVWRFPHPSKLYTEYLRHSLIAKLFGFQLEQKLDQKPNPDVTPPSFATTKKILEMVERRVGKIPVIAMVMGHETSTEFEKTSKELGWLFVDTQEPIAELANLGMPIDGSPHSKDWNAAAHFEVGKLLQETLHHNKLIPHQPVQPMGERITFGNYYLEQTGKHF